MLGCFAHRAHPLSVAAANGSNHLIGARPIRRRARLASRATCARPTAMAHESSSLFLCAVRNDRTDDGRRGRRLCDQQSWRCKIAVIKVIYDRRSGCWRLRFGTTGRPILARPVLLVTGPLTVWSGASCEPAVSLRSVPLRQSHCARREHLSAVFASLPHPSETCDRIAAHGHPFAARAERLSTLASVVVSPARPVFSFVVVVVIVGVGGVALERWRTAGGGERFDVRAAAVCPRPRPRRIRPIAPTALNDGEGRGRFCCRYIIKALLVLAAECGHMPDAVARRCRQEMRCAFVGTINNADGCSMRFQLAGCCKGLAPGRPFGQRPL
uniref:Uncharacterized protein n=1 Tax=Plectus sambesii TaxID=2011161 RepID=A0A914W6Z2_9BILA